MSEEFVPAGSGFVLRRVARDDRLEGWPSEQDLKVLACVSEGMCPVCLTRLDGEVIINEALPEREDERWANVRLTSQGGCENCPAVWVTIDGGWESWTVAGRVTIVEVDLDG